MLTDRATLCKDFSVKFGGNDGNFTIYKVFFSGTRQSDPIEPIVGTDMINPRRACAARVTVLALFVCVCVCLSVTTLAATAFVSACNQGIALKLVKKPSVQKLIAHFLDQRNTGTT